MENLHDRVTRIERDMKVEDKVQTALEAHGNADAYVSMWYGDDGKKVQLDGHFSPEELRAVADILERYNSE